MTQKAEGQLWIKFREMFMDEAEKFKAHQSHTMCSAHADQFGRDALEVVIAAGFRYVGPDDVVVPKTPSKEMIDAGETCLENQQDSTAGSDANGNWHEYTYFIAGLSGAALATYRAMIEATEAATPRPSEEPSA